VPWWAGETEAKSRNSSSFTERSASNSAIAGDFNKLNPYDPELVPEILKIEDVNYVDCNPQKPIRQLFGYAISAKRYALYSQTEIGIQIEKASGHGLGYLFSAKEGGKEKNADEETPQWVMEAWEFLMRRVLRLASKDPDWLNLPAMMRMVVTTPNVFRQRRPEWLGPFNFFLFPMLSETFFGYPAGFDKSNFVFITPYESDRKKWDSLKGINLVDGRQYQIAMQPSPNQDKVLPESLKILLRTYPTKLETKSLAPDGSPCTGMTHGLLRRATINANNLVPVGKETDRRWEQGEDPSMLDSETYVFKKQERMPVADPGDRKRWRATGVRAAIRKSGLSPTTVYAILEGKPVRRYILETFRRRVDG
jgi:hypothetical protein